jgi:hypothetical protein
MFVINKELSNSGAFFGVHRGVQISVEQDTSGFWVARYAGKSNTSTTKSDALNTALKNIDEMAII